MLGKIFLKKVQNVHYGMILSIFYVMFEKEKGKTENF